jgi:hypothetical protein
MNKDKLKAQVVSAEATNYKLQDQANDLFEIITT